MCDWPRCRLPIPPVPIKRKGKIRHVAPIAVLASNERGWTTACCADTVKGKTPYTSKIMEWLRSSFFFCMNGAGLFRNGCIGTIRETQNRKCYASSISRKKWKKIQPRSLRCLQSLICLDNWCFCKNTRLWLTGRDPWSPSGAKKSVQGKHFCFLKHFFSHHVIFYWK